MFITLVFNSINALLIDRLYGDLLYALDIRKLVIVDTPIFYIDPQVFLGINRTLQEFHLIRSNLQEFPTEAFQVKY